MAVRTGLPGVQGALRGLGRWPLARTSLQKPRGWEGISGGDLQKEAGSNGPNTTERKLLREMQDSIAMETHPCEVLWKEPSFAVAMATLAEN